MARAIAGIALLGSLPACGGSTTQNDCASSDGCDDSTAPADDSDEKSSKDAGSADATTPKKDAGTSAPLDSGTKAIDASSASKKLPCDVQALIDSHCSACHGATPAGGAPMSLVTWSDFQATAQDKKSKVYQAIKERVNESDPTKRMPPASITQFTDDELATLNAWLDQSAPAGTDTCTSTAAADAGTGLPDPDTDPSLECYKLTAHNGDFKTPFKVGTAVDSYFNFTFAAPWKGTAYAVAFKPVIGNMAAIHHWLLFQDDSKGTPGGAVPSIGAHPGGQLLSGWAPGGEDIDLRGRAPGGVGVELSDSVTYTIEFHYNSSDPNASDASGVEICTAKDKPANIAGLSWLGYDQLLVPSTTWTGTCDPANPGTAHILVVVPHMHLTGRHMTSIINRADGSQDTLQDADFDFNYQRLYNKDVTINPGDTITTTCTFSQPMSFGESTMDEMCYLFTYAYPKGVLTDNGAWGATAHGNSSCLGE